MQRLEVRGVVRPIYGLLGVKRLILIGIRENCLTSGSSRTLYLFMRRVIKQCTNYGSMPRLSTINKILFSSFCQDQRHMQRNYWLSSVWISKQQVNCWSYILYSSNIWEKISIKWSSKSTIYKLQERLWFS